MGAILLAIVIIGTVLGIFWDVLALVFKAIKEIIFFIAVIIGSIVSIIKTEINRDKAEKS